MGASLMPCDVAPTAARGRERRQIAPRPGHIGRQVTPCRRGHDQPRLDLILIPAQRDGLLSRRSPQPRLHPRPSDLRPGPLAHGQRQDPRDRRAQQLGPEHLHPLRDAQRQAVDQALVQPLGHRERHHARPLTLPFPRRGEGSRVALRLAVEGAMRRAALAAHDSESSGSSIKDAPRARCVAGIRSAPRRGRRGCEGPRRSPGAAGRRPWARRPASAAGPGRWGCRS